MIAQSEAVRHRRAIAVVTIAAGVMSLASLIVGLSGADFDFEAVSESATFIALGTGAVGPVAVDVRQLPAVGSRGPVAAALAPSGRPGGCGPGNGCRGLLHPARRGGCERAGIDPA